MTIKDLFGKKSAKPQSSLSLDDLREGVESYKNVSNKLELEKRFFPDIDFSKPENFSFYGSAEKYYLDSVDNISEFYPYDGSEAEKRQWELESSYLDRYVYENLYPRQVGHVALGKNYARGGTNSGGYYNTTTPEYITFYGSLNTGSANLSDESLYINFDNSNKYNKDSSKDNNLQFNGQDGVTTEFWLKKDTYNASLESSKQVLLDIWNRENYGTDSYGRYRIELQPGVSGNENKIVLEIMSGSSGSDYIPIGNSLDIDSNTWSQYSLTVKNEDSNLRVNLYKNGTLNQTLLTGSNINLVKGALYGHIGSLTTTVKGATGGTGFGKLSASLDEFRFWRSERSKNDIGLDWRTTLHGGNNSDPHLTSSLGVYYKFNEGVHTKDSVNSYDSTVLDYSGRTVNGRWVGYTTNSRITTSALEESSTVAKEEKDPVIYKTHPDVLSLRTSLEKSGSLYDQQNNNNLMNSLPNWIVNEDQGQLKNLTQVMSSYFDEAYLQIQSLTDLRKMSYTSSSLGSNTFGQNLLESYGFVAPDLFVDATLYETINDRGDEILYEKKMTDIKNLIYQNLYNNMVYLFKSKGTEKSIRNLIRGFGINEDHVRVNLYSDSGTYTIGDAYRHKSISKRYADFNDPSRFSATVYQMTSSNSVDQRSYITSSVNFKHEANTLEGEFIFPSRPESKYNFHFDVPFTQSSLMGINGASTADVGDTSWPATNPDLTIYAIRHTTDTPHAYFKLTSSYMGIDLTTGVYSGVYDNNKWNFAVKLGPKKYPYTNFVSGTTADSENTYEVEFYGTNYNTDIKENSFSIKSDVDTTKAINYLISDKRVFLGAKRTNHTGSVVDKTDVLASSVRFWNTKLSNEEVDHHAKDGEVFGINDTQQGLKTGNTVTKRDALALHWDFTNVTSSNASGQFVVEDATSGSLQDSQKIHIFGPSSRIQHPALGFGFIPNSTKSINKEYINVAKSNLPEVLSGEHLVRVLSQDDRNFTREFSPENFYISLEKSMYSTISEEMINTFGTMREINNLIGLPLEKYRQDYKELQKSKQKFFSNVRNEPDLEKYFEFYKWIDDTVLQVISQFLPASSQMVRANANIVESHVFERNKVQHQYPVFEERTPTIVSMTKGIGELKYSWSRGHAPVSQIQSRNCQWWQQRAEKDTTNAISDNIKSQREELFASMRETYKKEREKVVALSSDGLATLNENAKKIDYTKSETKFGTGAYLSIEASSVSLEKDCEDVLNPNEKIRYDFKVEKA